MPRKRGGDMPNQVLLFKEDQLSKRPEPTPVVSETVKVEHPTIQRLLDAANKLEKAVDDFVDRDNGSNPGGLLAFVRGSASSREVIEAIRQAVASQGLQLVELAEKAKRDGRHDLLLQYLGDAITVFEHYNQKKTA